MATDLVMNEKKPIIFIPVMTTNLSTGGSHQSSKSYSTSRAVTYSGRIALFSSKTLFGKIRKLAKT